MIRKAHKQRNGAAGDVIYAENAEPGKRYFCTMCGVGLHLMTRNGVSFFVCYPDTEHGDPYCRKLSSQDKRPHSMEKFDKDAFFSYFERTAEENLWSKVGQRKRKTPETIGVQWFPGCGSYSHSMVAGGLEVMS